MMQDAAGLDAVVVRLRAAGCVFAEDEAALLHEAAAGDLSRLAALVARRVAGVPLEVVVGWAEFRGRRVAVEAGVFVPRHRTGILVDLALAHARVSGYPETRVLAVELCAGVAAVASALVADAPGLDVYAAEVDPVAARVARRNLDAARVFEGDLYDALPSGLRGRVGILIANAPYVPTDEIALMPSEARDHEPRVALDGGADGLDVQRRVIAGASAWLHPGGVLLIETSVRQASATVALMEDAGLTARAVHDPDLDATAAVGLTPLSRRAR